MESIVDPDAFGYARMGRRRISESRSLTPRLFGRGLLLEGAIWPENIRFTRMKQYGGDFLGTTKVVGCEHHI